MKMESINNDMNNDMNNDDNNADNMNDVIENINNNNINNINNLFLKIIENYNKIYPKLTNSLNNYIIPYSSLLDLDVIMTNLSVELQSISMLIEMNENNHNNDNNLDNSFKYSFDNSFDNSFKKELNNDMQNDMQNDMDNDIIKEYDNKIKTDKLVNNTLNKMLPLIFLCMMMLDTESILNSRTFGQSIKNKYDENKLNGLPYINPNSNQNTDIDKDNKFFMDIDLD